MENEDMSDGNAGSAMDAINAEWQRQKAMVLRSLTETPLDKWLRRRR